MVPNQIDFGVRLTIQRYHSSKSMKLEAFTELYLIKCNSPLSIKLNCPSWGIRELKKPQRRLQQKSHKFAYLTMKNSIFARFARAFFIFCHFEDVLVLSTTWNDLFCSCVDDVSIWWQMFNFVFLCPKRWLQFNSRMVRTHFFKHNDFE